MPKFRLPKRRLEKPWIIIVCDGENTEPQYFRHLREFILLDSPIVLRNEDIVGRWYNRMRTITEWEKIFKSKRRLDSGYAELWCVFDGDPKKDDPNHDNWFVKAVAHVDSDKNNNWIKGAYSFEAFEYWLLLHFEPLNWDHIPREDYIRRLNEHLKIYGIEYDKNKKEITKELFDILMGDFQLQGRGATKRVDYAIENAERIDVDWIPIWKARERRSVTKVYKLVKRILGR